MKSKLSCACIGLFISSVSMAAQPLISITALYLAPKTLATNSFTAAVYQITNNASSSTTFTMQPIQGITQITTTAGACTNPISLAKGQSCNLNLRIIGSQVPAQITSGPVVCVNAPYGCSQPSMANSLNITSSAIYNKAQNNWISVLIDQDGLPADLATYVNQIIALAPSLEQIHLRVGGAESTDYAPYANVINLLRTAYPQTLQIGFHPDNSSGSIDSWGCTSTPTWECVLNASILSMNAMNAVADPNHTNEGFNIFSIEQSYLEPADSTTLKNIKVCLNPADGASGSNCPCLNPADSTDPVNCNGNPHVTTASPVVTFGNVLPSYGGSDLYGSDALDFGYPQYYNLGKRLDPNGVLIPGSPPLAPFFPTNTTTCVTNPYATDLDVVDVSASYPNPIPCNYPTGATVYVDPSTQAPTPSIAGTYVAYIMTQEPPISNTVDTNGATVYITFSGEASPTFLGAPGWSLSMISQFNADLMSGFGALQQYQTQDPSLTLFPSGGTSPSEIKYAIWSYAAILSNEN